MTNRAWFVILLYSLLGIYACSPGRKISREANSVLLTDSVIARGHLGISIYDPSTGKYLYNHQADKYFIPASNTKLFTLYAGMQYLGDSIEGLNYYTSNDSTYIFPTGDPSFLHPAYEQQPVFKFLQNCRHIVFNSSGFDQHLGAGWSWDDYTEPFLPQKSEMPVYGNLARIALSDKGLKVIPSAIPINIKDSLLLSGKYGLLLQKPWDKNEITVYSGNPTQTNIEYRIPFVPGKEDIIRYISDTLHQNMIAGSASLSKETQAIKVIHSQPTDAVLQPMMHKSDNFLAEQTLLMVSKRKLGTFNTNTIIEYLLNNDFSDIPSKPRWVDGSGLSRYNQFTPESFIYLMNKMTQSFGIDRMKKMFPTGGQGTLSNYFPADSNYIFGKTGSMSNNTSLCGFLYTRKGKLLYYSLLANNFQAPITTVRRSMEKFLIQLREKL